MVVLGRRVTSQLLHRSTFHACCQTGNSSSLYHGEARPLHQQDSRYTRSDRPKNGGARQHHHHHDRESPYTGKNWKKSIHLMHQSSTKHADLRHQLVPFHYQGHGEGHESSSRTLTNSIMRHSSYYRNRHLGLGQLAVCRIHSCGILCSTTVRSVLLCGSSPYSSSSFQDEEVKASSQSEVDSLLTDPRISGKYSREQVFGLNSFFNERDMPGYRIIKRCPQLLDYRLTTLNKKLKFFEGHGFDIDQMLRLLTYAKERTVLGLSLSNLQNHVQFLKDIGFCNDDIKWVFLQDPRYPFFNVERNLYRALIFCIEAGLNMQAFRGLVRSRPSLFTYSTERFLFEKPRLLQDLVGTRASKILEKETRLPIYESRHAVLLSLGLSKEDLYKMCKRHPQLITLKEDTMEQKVNYLTKVLNRDVRELINFPLFLSYSLQKRIIPRFKRIDELLTRGLLKEQPSLYDVLKCSSLEFEKKYALGGAKTKSESFGR